MSEIFIKVLNMSISASWIILTVLLLRSVLKKAPKWITVLLWGIVAVRLICPFNFESALSLIPSAETINPEVAINPPAIDSGISVIDNIINPIIGTTTITLQPEKDVNLFQAIMPYLAVLWLVGMAALLIYTAISFLRIKHKIGTAVLLKGNIYQSENVISPFVLGIIKPKIYLPFNMNEQDAEHVISHEKAHICRKDHLWKTLGFLILTIHWFNPLMWLGYVLLCRDIEIACDEKVIKELNTEQKADYSQTLLTCSVNRRMISACPLAFGEVGTKKRVKSVLNYRKPSFWISTISVVSLIIAAVCSLTNPKNYDIKNLDSELKAFLDMQVTEQNGSDKSNANFAAVSYDLMKVDKSGYKTTVYAWICYQEYSYENDLFAKEGGSYIPTVVTTQKNGNSYELVEYWTPRDGSCWVDDIKEKFPKRLWARAMDSQRSAYKQNAECEQMAREHFGIPESTAGNSSGSQVVVTTADLYKFRSDKDMAVLSLSTTDNTASFSYSLLSSYMAYGIYENDGNYIVMKTDDGRFKYTFKKENDTMRFVSSKSSELPSYAYSSGAKAEICVPDGAVFEKVRQFESTISFVDRSTANKIYFSALNSDKMIISSVRHLPIWKFDELSELEEFKQTIENAYTTGRTMGDFPSFNDATEKYDSAFFETNSLLLVCVSAGNTTNRFELHSVGYDENTFTVHIAETTNAEVTDTAMANWFITVAVSDEIIKNCTKFDADLNNGLKLLSEQSTAAEG